MVNAIYTHGPAQVYNAVWARFVRAENAMRDVEFLIGQNARAYLAAKRDRAERTMALLGKDLLDLHKDLHAADKELREARIAIQKDGGARYP